MGHLLGSAHATDRESNQPTKGSPIQILEARHITIKGDMAILVIKVVEGQLAQEERGRPPEPRGKNPMAWMHEKEPRQVYVEFKILKGY